MTLADIFPPHPGFGAPYRVVGTITLLRPTTFHYMAQYPGADTHTACEPQTVPLESNGYMARATFTGTVTGRGYYGGDLDVPGRHDWSTYAYNVDAFLGHPRSYHAEGNIVQSCQDAWGTMFKIILD